MPKKCASGWRVDLRPEGRKGPRIRRIFDTKRDADFFKKEQMALGVKGEWKRPVKETRRLHDLGEDWFSLHGYTLKDGTKRKGKLDAICKRLGNPLARTFTGEDFLRYRRQRLGEKLKNRDRFVSPNNLNHEQAYLSAVFGTLIKLRNWELPNPMKDLPKIRLDEKELIFLEQNQIRVLLAELENSKNSDVLLVTKLCLATGSRWGEAEGLKAERILQGKVHFTKTKNSKARAVPISPELEAELRKGKPRIGRLFNQTCHDAFKGAVERAGIQLPDGQMTHVLRHTFASHYMMNNGNILRLKLILGHQSLAMTERYAKLAPEHLADAVTKNPLANLEGPQSVHTAVSEYP